MIKHLLFHSLSILFQTSSLQVRFQLKMHDFQNFMLFNGETALTLGQHLPVQNHLLL